MKRLTTLLCALGISSTTFAVDCTDERGSCFRVFNNYEKQARLICFEATKNQPFQISVSKNSEYSLNLDQNGNDGLGSPLKDNINCYLSFNGEMSMKRFNFLNPVHGPAISVFINSDGDGVMVTVSDKETHIANYDFEF